MWRNFDDIQDSWQSVASVIDYYGDNQDTIIPNAGPGHWNDPDMVRKRGKRPSRKQFAQKMPLIWEEAEKFVER